METAIFVVMIDWSCAFFVGFHFILVLCREWGHISSFRGEGDVGGVCGRKSESRMFTYSAELIGTTSENHGRISLY